MKLPPNSERSRQQPPEVELEKDERILFYESRQDVALTMPNLILGLLLFLGFPFYGMMLIVGGGGLISGASFDDIWPMIENPLIILTVEAIVLCIVIPLLKQRIDELLPTAKHLVVTNKRIFNLATNVSFPKDLPVVTQESRYDEVMLITREQSKNSGLLKVKVKKANPCDEEAREQSYMYSASNASLAYSCIPREITQRKGPKSFAGKKELEQYKRDGIVARGVAGFVTCMLLALGSCLVQQESAVKYLRSSRDAYMRKDYKQAEESAQQAYDRLSRIPFHDYYGPACYRLAIAYVANGKSDAAIPLFKEAGERCSSGEDIDWRAAKFRSHAHLAQIFQARGDLQQSQQFFQRALAESELEPEKQRIVAVCNQYADSLKTQGKSGEVPSILAIADKAVDRPNSDTFRE